MSRLRIALLFHFNQNLNQYSQIASQACYRGLLRMLRRHQRLPFCIHISGTLIHALQWYDPEPLQMIADGLADGQFTLLGSTYAQNVPYASDDWDNILQMMLHRTVLQRTFGSHPTLFWNPERCWRASLIPPLAAAGYTNTLVETGILRQAGCPQPYAVWQTSHDGQPLTLFADDQDLKNAVNYAIWTGRSARALAYLQALARQPDSARFFVWYAEDAEATGLWGYAKGVAPQSAWANLDRFLTELEQQPWLRVCSPQQAPPVQGLLPTIPDGQASWMAAALRDARRPYYEAGYHDWFDFQAHAPKLQHFRQFFAVIRQRLQAGQAAVASAADPAPAAVALIAQAHLAFAAHQFEFGCIGIGARGDRQWEMARAALVCLRAAELAQTPTPPHAWLEDVDTDGVAEICLANARIFAVFTRLGGRLLYAFDLQQGVSWAGNENAMTSAPWAPGNLFPQPPTAPQRRHNDALPLASFSPRPADPRPLWGQFLPDDWWEGEPAALPTLFIAPPPADAPPAARFAAAQTGALADSIWLDDRLLLQPADQAVWQVEIGQAAVEFAHTCGPLALRKRIALSPDDSTVLEVAYSLRLTPAVTPTTVRLAIANELCPASVAVLDAGRDTLLHHETEGATVAGVSANTCGLLNQAANYLVSWRAQPAPDAVASEDGLFALILTPTFTWRLQPSAPQAGVTMWWRSEGVGSRE